MFSFPPHTVSRAGWFPTPPGGGSGPVGRIRQDAWNGRGPGRYVLQARDLKVLPGGGMSLPRLMLDGNEVGYLHGGSDQSAQALSRIVQSRGPTDLELQGHYGNTAFYIDRIDLAAPGSGGPSAPHGAPGRPASTPGASGNLPQVIRQIREDAWNGRGPGCYQLPQVLDLSVAPGSGLPTLLANGLPVGYLHGGSEHQAEAVGAMLQHSGGEVRVRGHYGNTAFYIDRVELVPAGSAPGSSAGFGPSSGSSAGSAGFGPSTAQPAGAAGFGPSAAPSAAVPPTALPATANANEASVPSSGSGSGVSASGDVVLVGGARIRKRASKIPMPQSST